MNEELINEDLKYIFHPCTQMSDHFKNLFPLIPIKKAKGVYLEDFEGNRFIDAISSWWVNNLGHTNEFIANNIKNQLEILEHVIFAGFTHTPAINLAKKLVEITPKGLNKVFFADNGSSGIEVALKLAFHYFSNKGEVRDKFISLTNSYHGETLGALAVSDMGLYKDIYEPILIKTLQTPAPKNKSGVETKKALNELENLLKEKHNEVCALILEPLIQCAGNMQMHSSDFLVGVRKLTKKYNIFLIADEVAVGFGRTGKMFACEHANISPDLMVLSKGLTGGFLPLSVVLMTDEIYNGFLCDYKSGKSFLHSHSYTANPLSCTAALSTIEYFEKENILNKLKPKIRLIENRLKNLKKFDFIKNIRQTGMVAAFEVDLQIERINLVIYKKALKKGVLLRPLQNTIYLMPPLVIKENELNLVFDMIDEILKDL